MQYNPSIELENENSSHVLLIRLAGQGKNVLDVGCARGYIGAVLANRFGCTVSGIEVDDAAAAIARTAYREVLVGDVEDLSLLGRLRHGPFDVILFGDVLEHLRRPERVLAACRALLKPDGHALISLPNVVTLRLRLRFLLGRFEYTDQGIMDRSHLRFFTLDSAREMIRAAGYAIDRFEFIVGPNFGRRLARLGIAKRLVPPSLLGTQFVFKARPVRD
jgi:2-polyprenyl-3-methyl-5-hydroxy-6-metoxy-1,4-benzoquinol methylase